jgi:hypothetical protein
LRLREQLRVPMKDKNDSEPQPQQEQSERLQFLQTFHLNSPVVKPIDARDCRPSAPNYYCKRFAL